MEDTMEAMVDMVDITVDITVDIMEVITAATGDMVDTTADMVDITADMDIIKNYV